MGTSANNPVAGNNIQIDDPISAAQARELLGVSKEKMSKLLKTKLKWRPSELDERVKLVSKRDVLELKKDIPTRSASQKPQGKDEHKASRQRPQSQGQGDQPTRSQGIYLSEWMQRQNIDASTLVKRSQQWVANQHTASGIPSAERAAVLRTKPVSLPTIRRIMNRQQYPLPVTIERLAAALGITPEQLGQHPPEGQ